MERVRPLCGQPSDRGWLKNRTEQIVLEIQRATCELSPIFSYPYLHLASSLGLTLVEFHRDLCRQ